MCPSDSFKESSLLAFFRLLLGTLEYFEDPGSDRYSFDIKGKGVHPLFRKNHSENREDEFHHTPGIIDLALSADGQDHLLGLVIHEIERE
jgi:hypothetical protein